MVANVIQSGRREGMQTMDDALFGLIQGKRITPEEAYSVASDKKRFEALLPKQEVPEA
jgi:twitching motility protein PilT